MNDWDVSFDFPYPKQCLYNRDAYQTPFPFIKEYVNYWDETFDYQCPSNSYITEMHSHTHFTFITGYVNDWDDAFSYNCPNNGYISGMSSYHDSKHEDRRWKIKCCSVSSKFGTCIQYGTCADPEVDRGSGPSLLVNHTWL